MLNRSEAHSIARRLVEGFFGQHVIGIAAALKDVLDRRGAPRCGVLVRRIRFLVRIDRAASGADPFREADGGLVPIEIGRAAGDLDVAVRNFPFEPRGVDRRQEGLGEIDAVFEQAAPDFVEQRACRRVVDAFPIAGQLLIADPHRTGDFLQDELNEIGIIAVRAVAVRNNHVLARQEMHDAGIVDHDGVAPAIVEIAFDPRIDRAVFRPRRQSPFKVFGRAGRLDEEAVDRRLERRRQFRPVDAVDHLRRDHGFGEPRDAAHLLHAPRREDMHELGASGPPARRDIVPAGRAQRRMGIVGVPGTDVIADRRAIGVHTHAVAQHGSFLVRSIVRRRNALGFDQHDVGRVRQATIIVANFRRRLAVAQIGQISQLRHRAEGQALASVTAALDVVRPHLEPRLHLARPVHAPIDVAAEQRIDGLRGKLDATADDRFDAAIEATVDPAIILVEVARAAKDQVDVARRYRPGKARTLRPAAHFRDVPARGVTLVAAEHG